MIRNGTSENTERRDVVPVDRRHGDRPDPAPGAALQDPEHDQPKRDRRQRRAAVVELRRVVGLGRALHPPVHCEHRDHHDDLAHEDVPPRPGGRHVAADQRARRDRRARGAADHRVGERALLALVVRGGQGRDRRDHQHRAQPLDPRPANQQHRQVRAERGDQRAQPVHGQPQTECPITAQNVTELRADEHERRHHERVHRDRALDTGDRRVQIVHDLRDRDVHHARVEHHDELGRRQDDQGKPFAHASTLRHQAAEPRATCPRRPSAHAVTNAVERRECAAAARGRARRRRRRARRTRDTATADARPPGTCACHRSSSRSGPRTSGFPGREPSRRPGEGARASVHEPRSPYVYGRAS